MNLRVLSICGLAAVLAPAALQAQANGSDAAGNWAAFAECAAIDGSDARHACMDNLARRAGLLSDTRAARETRQEFGREDLAEAPRSAPSPAPATTPGAAVSAAAAPPRAADIQEMVTTIASVRSIGYQRLRVTTAEGSVWDQKQAEAFSVAPRVGDTFAVQRGSLGSFRCRFGQASRYQCERVS